MLSPVRLSVCRLSVTLVCPTYRRLKFSGMFLLGTLATGLIHETFTEIVPGKLLRGGVKHKRGSQYSDFGLIDGYISETVQDRRLVLITNRKLYELSIGTKIGDLVNDLERHNGGYFALFYRIRVASGRTA